MVKKRRAGDESDTVERHRSLELEPDKMTEKTPLLAATEEADYLKSVRASSAPSGVIELVATDDLP